MLIDSHCHLQSSEFYPENREEVYKRAIEAGVKMIVVGTSEADSVEAVEFASSHDGVWAVVGVHPHDTKQGWKGIKTILADHFSNQAATRHDEAANASLRPVELAMLRQSSAGQESFAASSGSSNNSSKKQPAKIVGVGEIGLDYFYDNSPREVQIRALEEQLQWAVDYNLPVSFHVREAYSDFWPVFDNFSGVRGVLHCFTDTAVTLEQALKRNLYIGVNGISTFTKDPEQQKMFAAIPLGHMLLETDAPFLTPRPLRGTINEPVYVVEVAKHQANVKNVSLDEIIAETTANTMNLFAL